MRPRDDARVGPFPKIARSHRTRCAATRRHASSCVVPSLLRRLTKSYEETAGLTLVDNSECGQRGGGACNDQGEFLFRSVISRSYTAGHDAPFAAPRLHDLPDKHPAALRGSPGPARPAHAIASAPRHRDHRDTGGDCWSEGLGRQGDVREAAGTVAVMKRPRHVPV